MCTCITESGAVEVEGQCVCQIEQVLLSGMQWSVAHFTFKLTMSIHVQFSMKRCIVMLKTIQKMMLYTNKAYL